MPADQEIITISDSESDDDDIDHYIKTLFPPPCPPSNTKPTVKPFVNPSNELGVDLPPGVQLLPSLRFPTTCKGAPVIWGAALAACLRDNLKATPTEPPTIAKPKPVTSEPPTIVKPKRKVVWRVALGTANGRDTRDTKRHRKRTVHHGGKS
jgi:hypothetical protein